MTPVKKKTGAIYPNEQLSHPFARSHTAADRAPFQYRFLRVTRLPLDDRPDSGRILVLNESTGERQEFYALLFGVTFE
jgi:hypothetical protein